MASKKWLLFKPRLSWTLDVLAFLKGLFGSSYECKKKLSSMWVLKSEITGDGSFLLVYYSVICSESIQKNYKVI